MRLDAWAMILATGPFAACVYRPTIEHPTLAAPTAAAITLTCEQIDLAVARADTVRWVIRDDGGQLESDSSRAARYSVNVLLVALAPFTIPEGGHRVLDAADQRVLALLQLKQDRRCPSRPTTFPGKDDFALAAEVEALQARIAGEEGWAKSLLEERTRLLDGLRVLPPAD